MLATTRSKFLVAICLVFMHLNLFGCDQLFAKAGSTHNIIIEADTAELERHTTSKNSTDAIMDESIKIITRRLEQVAPEKPIIARLGANKIGIKIVGVKDASEVRRFLETPGKRLSFRLVDDTVSQEDIEIGRSPAGSEILQFSDGSGAIAVRILGGISGSNIIGAIPGFDPISNEPTVNIKFDTTGTMQFGELTNHYVGKMIAIVIDQKVISAPRINEPILGGEVQISGNFSAQDANELAINLNAGALPIKFNILEFSVVE
jgi:protein-export membrane protein SecD